MAKFYFKWDTGFETEVQLPSSSNSCNNTYSSVYNKHNIAKSGILTGDDPNADENSIGYLTDKLAYYMQGEAALIDWVGKSKAMQKWWDGKYKGCKGCCDLWVFGTCTIQCNCHTKGAYCNTTQGGLNDEKNNWWKIVGVWNDGLAGIQTLIESTNKALEDANALIQTQIEQQENAAIVNQIIAETNLQIAYAQGKEGEVEEEMRISKFFTIILPILIVVLVIGLVIIWNKK